jgi:tRNA A-37 threonylcarbamoyl transferase component Bud32
MNLTKIGRYEIKAELGRGGMATVYRAFDPSFGREVAIKVLPREFLHDVDFRARFEREAKIIAALEYPEIVPVYDFGQEADQPYIVMRLMSGGSLADWLHQGPIPLKQTVEILTRLSRALDRTHARGIIHRDLKPSNFLLDSEKEPYIADFGIAKLTAESSTLSQNTIIGTPAYMSPEQWYGENLDGQCDVYALGVITFQMLSGQLPYQANIAPALMKKHLLDPVPRILDVNSGLPAEIQEVIEQAMAKRKDDRFATAGKMAEALAAVTRQPSSVMPDEPAIAEVSVVLPEIARPMDLGFETSGMMSQLLAWFNSFFYVDGVSTGYQFQLLPREGSLGGTCVMMHNPSARQGEFGSLMQRCLASHLAGKEIRFEGEIATKDLSQWAGIWLRADSTLKMLFFDNMHDRPIRGTTEWTRYAIETRLPEETKWLNYGVVLVGRGLLWADNFRLMVRGADQDWIDLDK